MQCPVHHSILLLIKQPTHDKYCQMCHRHSSIQCSMCKFSLCSNCRICDKKHFLVKMFNLEKVDSGYYNNAYRCSICNMSRTSDDDGLWHCNQCNYDVCPQCID